MAPSETSILTNFLLSPASFTTIISLEQFTELFPRVHRSNPQVKLLYRELQHLRALDLDEVKTSVAREVERGQKQKQELRRARKSSTDKSFAGEDVREASMDSYLFGSTSNLPNGQPYSFTALVTDMSRACEDLDIEIASLQIEIERVSEDLEATVGDLSDLRYGKFDPVPGSNGVAEEVVQSLHRLNEVTSDSRRGQLSR